MRATSLKARQDFKRTAGRILFSAMGAIYRLFARKERPAGIRKVDPSELKRILVVNLLRIGDSVVALPAIHALRAAVGQAPNATMTVFVRPQIVPIYRTNPAIDELVTDERAVHGRGFDLALVLDTSFRGNLVAWRARAKRRVGYDSHGRGFLLTDSEPAPEYWNTAVCDYAADTRPQHQVESWLHLVEAMGIAVSERSPRLSLTREGREFADTFWRFHDHAGGESPKILLHPGSSPSYRWKPERFASVADALVTRYNAKVAITGSRQDKVLAEWIQNAAERKIVDATGIELDEFAALVGSSDLVISVDTCATHIAAALDVPAVALFGPGDPNIWRPYGSHHVVVRSDDSTCLGCKRAECFHEEHTCMDSISVERVIEAAERILKRREI